MKINQNENEKRKIEKTKSTFCNSDKSTVVEWKDIY